jgi:hypothetical protein
MNMYIYISIYVYILRCICRSIYEICMYVFYTYIYIHAFSHVCLHIHVGQTASSNRDKASVQKMIGDWAGSHGEDDGGTYPLHPTPLSIPYTLPTPYTLTHPLYPHPALPSLTFYTLYILYPPSPPILYGEDD